MKYLAVTILTFLLCSCERSANLDLQQIRAWSSSSETKSRKIASVYSYQKKDGSYIIISTAEMKIHADGTEPSGEEILEEGFLVYPGPHKVGSIDKALELIEEINGLTFKLNASN